jgi:cytochrome c oxidase subunit 3/cytochrome o ubiquinol oxidase subunit 3
MIAVFLCVLCVLCGEILFLPPGGLMSAPPETDVKEVLPESAAAPPDHTLGIEPRPEPHKAGMVCFLVSEAAFFGTLIMTYVIFLRHGGTGPTPREVLTLGLVLVNTAFLLTSSLTAHLAERALRGGNRGMFHLLWMGTILLGVLFLVGTAVEWRGLIRDHGLTIGINMFGTTYYTLVGFHALHVTLGVIALTSVLLVSLAGKLREGEPLPVTLVGWYWHFVDAVWVVVFFVVYVFGR